MKIKNILTLLLLISIFSSCSMEPLKRGTLVFDGKNDEIIAIQGIRDFMAITSNPSVVLRVPNASDDITKTVVNDYIYNAIEKELIINGFNVKDRALFNEVLNKKRESVSYHEINQLTGTDLILELVNINTDIKFTTNKIITKEGEEKAYKRTVTKYGASIEFKLILVKENLFAGSYTFYYIPCTKENINDCNCYIGYKSYDIYPQINFCKQVAPTVQDFEYVASDVMEEFVRNGIRLMINEIRK